MTLRRQKIKECAARCPRAVLVVMCLVFVVGLLDRLGVTDALDRKLLEARFWLLERNVTGEIVVVDIDAKSLNEIGTWPLPRRLHADLVDRLADAGAQDVVFDVDFSSASVPEDDRLFAEALDRAGNVSLAMFAQKSSGAQVQGMGETVNRPQDRFLEAAWPVIVMVPIEPDSRVWRNLYGYPADGQDEISAAAYMAGYSGDITGSFWIDYSLKVSDMPVISFVDVVTGRFDPASVWGKKVIVGASAQELRDLFPVPVHGILSGSMIQALGGETLLQNRALAFRGEIAAIIGVALVVFLLMMTVAEGWLVKLAILGLSALALETVALAIQSLHPIIWGTGEGELILALAAGAIVAREIGFRKLLERLAKARERNSLRMLGRVLDDSFDAIVVVDTDHRILAASRTAQSILGPKIHRGDNARDVLPDELYRAVCDALARTDGIQPDRMTMRHEEPGEDPVFIEYVATQSRQSNLGEDGDAGEEDKIVACLTCRDVTEQRLSANRLAYLAKYDSTTDLLNRGGFEDEIGARLKQRKPGGKQLCVVQFAISNFDQIIASLGYSHGEQLRKAAANRLRSHLSFNVTWASLAGDVFAGLFLLENGEEDAARLAEAVRTVMAEDYAVSGARITVRLSVGYLVITEEADAETVLQRAGNALSQAQRDPNAKIHGFHTGMDESLKRRHKLETELTHAIMRDELKVVYQPQVDLKTREFIGAEALLRWENRELGWISPVEFIPIAEESGHIVELGAWVLNRAMNEAKSWPMPLSLAVNVSAIQFARSDFVSTVTEALQRTGFPATRLDLEMTESLFIDESLDLSGPIDALRALGCRFSLDDFGTGYSSLGYLPRFPFSKIKVDKSFVDNICTSRQDAALIEAVVHMVTAFDMKVLVEGIETLDQADKLRDLRCDSAQGYYFGKPMDSAEFIGLMRAAA